MTDIAKHGSTSLLETEISIYGNVFDKQGNVGTFADFLRLGISHKEDIARLRSCESEEERKRIKTSLPTATISGVFAPSRKVENLQKHSGYICIDIDHTDEDTASVMTLLRSMDIVAFASRSVSGKGIFAVIPIEHPAKHKQHFESLRAFFQKKKIEIDKACSDVSRMRVVSFDPQAIYRPTATPYRGILEERRRTTSLDLNYNDNVLAQVADCCRQIVSQQVDITDGYRNWQYIGFSLASLGEEGRGFFHAVSSVNPEYNPYKCDKKFNELSAVKSIGIGTFLYHCKQHDIEPRNNG